MWVGLYYILSHESTYCKPTPLFCAEVRVLAHELIIHTLRYMHRKCSFLSTIVVQCTSQWFVHVMRLGFNVSHQWSIGVTCRAAVLFGSYSTFSCNSLSGRNFFTSGRTHIL